MAYTKKQIQSVLADIEADLQKSYEEAKGELLAKADGEEDKEPGSPPAASDSSSPAAESASEAVPDAPGAAPAAPDASASAPAAPPADAPVDPAAQQQQPLTPEALQAEYSQLPPEELDMHIMAATAAKQALMGAASPGAAGGMPPPPGAGAPPALPAMSPPPAASPAGSPPPDAFKGELAINKEANGGKMTKTEIELKAIIETQSAMLKSLNEDVENLTKSIKTVVERPMRKAVTTLSDTNLTKAELAPRSIADVHKYIGDNASKLTKSERELYLAVIDNKEPASKLAPVLTRLVEQK